MLQTVWWFPGEAMLRGLRAVAPGCTQAESSSFILWHCSHGPGFVEHCPWLSLSLSHGSAPQSLAALQLLDSTLPVTIRTHGSCVGSGPHSPAKGLPKTSVSQGPNKKQWNKNNDKVKIELLCSGLWILLITYYLTCNWHSFHTLKWSMFDGHLVLFLSRF